MKKVIDVTTNKEFLVGKCNIKEVIKKDDFAIITLLSNEKIKVKVNNFNEYYLLVNSFLR